MRTRDEWKRTFKRTKDPYAYKRFSREVKYEIRMAEREFIARQINNNNNTNSLWKSIRSCIPKKSASQKTYSKSTKVLADEFNQFFASVGENTVKKINALAEKFSYEPNEPAFVPRKYPSSEEFAFHSTVKWEEVERIIKRREAEVGSENSTPRAMIVKLSGYGTKVKFMKARKGLRVKQIYINEDLTKVNHDFLVRVKKSCIDGVALYTADGNVMARCSTTKRVYRIDKIDGLKSHGFFKTAPNAA